MRVSPGNGFEWIETSEGAALVCRPLERAAPHLFTTREWALGRTSASNAGAWTPVAEALGVGPSRLARLHQVHGASVVVHRAGDAVDPSDLPPRDIVVSDDPSLAIAVQTADCVPILLADRRTGAVGAAHAGWRGLAAHVPAKAVAAMTVEFGTSPRDIVAAIGPCISAGRYEIDRAVRSRFEAAFDAAAIARWFPSATRDDHWLFDGWRSAEDQLEAAGVPRDQIYTARLCTAEHPDLFCSYRRDGTGAGRMAAAIRAGTTD